LYRRTQPHAGFQVLRRWAERLPHGGTVYTSNVDGQFQAAGVDAGAVQECHGSIHVLQCLTPCGEHLWSADGFEPDVDEEALQLRGELPRCPRCHGLARPNVLMFGDGEWIETRSAEQEARQRTWLARVRRPVVVELGAGTAIPSVRWFGERVCREHGASLVRINPRDSAVDRPQDVALPLGSLAALVAIEAALSRP
jgi:NAD-dependent SIR2 family protein deacetylase